MDKLDLVPNTGFGEIGTSPSASECSDGIDNDADSKIDFPADPGCSSSADNDETDVQPPPTTTPPAQQPPAKKCKKGRKLKKGKCVKKKRKKQAKTLPF